MMGTLREYPCLFTIVSRWSLLRMGNIWDKICRGNQNTYFMFTDFLFLNNLGVYEIICTNMGVRQETEDKIMWRMRFACWITKVTQTHTHTHTHTKYWYSRAKMVRQTGFNVTSYVHSLSCLFFCSNLDTPHLFYRVNIKSFPDYKHLLQENYCTWNTNIRIFFKNVTQEFFYDTSVPFNMCSFCCTENV